jgi:uncharacterized protein (TIGR03067 family)
VNAILLSIVLSTTPSDSFLSTRDVAADDRTDICGLWKVVGYRQNGADELELHCDSHVTFTFERVSKCGAKDLKESGVYRIDRRKTPTEIEFVNEDGGVSTRGILRVQGDSMQLAFRDRDQNLPQDFASEPGSNVTLITLRRLRK